MPAVPPNPLGEARAFFRRGNFEAALQKYQELLQEHPNSPDAYAGMTRVYLKMKDLEKAHDTVTKALQVADSPDVRVALGEVYFRQGNIAQADQEWVNVVNSGHANARAYLGLARVRWAVSMYKGGRTMIDKAHNLDPADPDIQKPWISKLSRAERIKYLEDYLAGETNDDPDTISAMRHYLEYLKARDKEPRRTCHLVSNATSTEAELVDFEYNPRP